ncbi:MAG TPA: hypothetical protein G4N95_01690 [Anaerolineae bacterium]|nr:hypothetical protein [Anaerolineae bacterium]
MNEDTTPQYCYYHPNVETSLRCNKCGRPICSKCAILTPTGYRCPDCVKAQQKKFDTAQWFDYPIGFTVAGILSFLGSIFADKLGFFIIFLAPIAGTVITEAARTATRKRRSKKLFRSIAGGALVGSLPTLLISLFSVFGALGNFGHGGLAFFSPLIWRSVYSIIVTTTVYSQISGLIFKR